jgi:SAM-dependent methyltransferase
MQATRQRRSLGRHARTGFTAAQADEIADVAETQGWRAAAHDSMRALDHAAYRLAIDEYRAQVRFLLPLTAESRVLDLRCGWGSVALNLATCTAFVVAMDGRRARLRFVSARRAETRVDTLHAVCANPAPHLPFAAGTFDAAIMLDALDRPSAGTGARGGKAHRAVLREVRRVLKPGGWLLLGAANRLGFARPGAEARQHLCTYWGYRQSLATAGFAELACHAPLPSHHEPFFILPLDRPRLLDRFIDDLFAAQDYRSKLEARGLGAVYGLARAMWHIGRRARLTVLARCIVPSYLILARK